MKGGWCTGESDLIIKASKQRETQVEPVGGLVAETTD